MPEGFMRLRTKMTVSKTTLTTLRAGSSFGADLAHRRVDVRVDFLFAVPLGEDFFPNRGEVVVEALVPRRLVVGLRRLHALDPQFVVAEEHLERGVWSNAELSPKLGRDRDLTAPWWGDDTGLALDLGHRDTFLAD
jgi:hypothetical protein